MTNDRPPLSPAHRPRIGWREWLALPDLGIPAIKAKIDTGARTSALHTFEAQVIRAKGQDRLRFSVHPLQRRNDVAITCVAPLLDQRIVRSSGGHRQHRYVIETRLRLGALEWSAELTLTDRDPMLFRMLLGRSALDSLVVIDPGNSYLAGGRPNLRQLYGYPTGPHLTGL